MRRENATAILGEDYGDVPNGALSTVPGTGTHTEPDHHHNDQLTYFGGVDLFGGLFLLGLVSLLLATCASDAFYQAPARANRRYEAVST